VNISSPSPCLPWWDAKTIEVVGPDVGDVSSGHQTGVRSNKPSVSLMTHVLETCDHVSYADVQGKPEWEKAMQAEMNSLLKNHTWDLVPRPQGKNIVKCRWVYKTKFTFEGVVEHHKACLVAKGFSQQEGIDYTETFSLVAKMNYVRLILSLVARFGWKIHQMDVKSSFLHGDLSEEIFMEQPPSFVTDSNLVFDYKSLFMV
jgi:hypothetical protein